MDQEDRRRKVMVVGAAGGPDGAGQLCNAERWEAG
jgi:hypothetical protein